MKEIIGKIVAILGDKEVVINRGRMDNIIEGMVFGVKLLIPDIVDPDDITNVLSGFFYTKAKIKIESLVDRMSFGSIQPKITKSTRYPQNLLYTENYEFPTIADKKLINDDDWKIKVGDEVYLMPVEKETKK